MLSLPLLLLSAGCAQTPIAAQCPPPPPVPEILRQPPDTAPSSQERIETLLRDFEQKLNDATGTGSD